MKRYLLIVGMAIAVSSCTTNTSDEGAIDSLVDNSQKTAVNETLCFQKISGTLNQDTATISLNFDGDEVTGDFENKPFEKDSRKGRIQAILKDDVVEGLWIYMQEGMTDTLPVEFKLGDDKLIQKNYTVDSKTGREIFSEGSIFNIHFEKIECNN